MQKSRIHLSDPLLVEAYEHAASKNILASLNPRVFFGYFSVCADGVAFGGNTTYVGLDWGESAEALLCLGRVPEVLASWDYVKSFQRDDGQLPLCISPDRAGSTVLKRNLYPITFAANGALFEHFCPGNPLRALPVVTFLETADAIYRHTLDRRWLAEQMEFIRRATRWQESLIDEYGRVGGAGFYLERPVRIEFDGLTQCTTAHALRLAADLFDVTGDAKSDAHSRSLSQRIATSFQRNFWVGDHFAEYIHPERGVIAHHGLTDVDWAALACDVATPEQVNVLWPKLKSAELFYYGGMPTGIATHPETYEEWEFPIADQQNPAVKDRHDLAAMGRVWFLECWARWRMGDREGILETLRRVARVGQENDWYWHERYYPSQQHLVPAGAEKYCEYPANFIRIVHRFVNE